MSMREALLARFPLPEWALFFEVSNGTGHHARRYADAVAMNCYPSRGMEVHGVEVKHARSDWLRELKQPEKSTDVQQYCDRWWIAVVPGVVKIEELPITWGLLELKDGKLRQLKAAPPLEAKPITRTFMASVLRSAGKVDDQMVRRMIDKETAELRQRYDQWLNSELAARRDKAGEIMKKVEEIKAKTGIDLAGWAPTDDVAAAIRFSMAGNLGTRYGGLRNLSKDMVAFGERITTALKDAGIEEES